MASPASSTLEDDPLALPQHAERRADQGVGREVVVAEVGVAEDHAVAGTGVVRLDHALHERASSELGTGWTNRTLTFGKPTKRADGEGARYAGRPALTTLPALMQPVQTWSRLGAPLTMARTRWMFGFQRRFVRRWEWLTDMPKPGFLPQMSQTAAIGRTKVPAAGEAHPIRARAPTSPPLMPPSTSLDAAALRAVVSGYRDALAAHREAHQPAQRLPRPRRRHRHQHGPHAAVGV